MPGSCNGKRYARRTKASPVVLRKEGGEEKKKPREAVDFGIYLYNAVLSERRFYLRFGCFTS